MEREPFFDPVYLTRPIIPDLDNYRKRLGTVWEKKWFTNNGEQHQLLEQRLKKYLGVPQISLFNNGTIALMTACRCLKLSGEVITTPFTFPATPHALTWNNLTPVFCDIEAETCNLDTDKLESAITPKTTAIVPVHIFGTPCNIRKIQKIADSYGLNVIYDAAHAFGVRTGNTGIGNFGDITMFSFHATKQFHTAEGGALTFRDPDLKEKIDLLKNFGIKNEDEVITAGINGKMNELQAALGMEVMGYLDAEQAQRKRLHATYMQKLKNVSGIILPHTRRDVRGNYQFFAIRIEREKFGISRNEVHENLKRYNVFTRKYFSPLCSDYECYRHLSSASETNLPTAHKAAGEILCLPLYGSLLQEDIEKICEIMISFQKYEEQDQG
jgi:dTDP-4-amino-4,6-dideoxygalactose transaminase